MKTAVVINCAPCGTALNHWIVQDVPLARTPGRTGSKTDSPPERPWKNCPALDSYSIVLYLLLGPAVLSLYCYLVCYTRHV